MYSFVYVFRLSLPLLFSTLLCLPVLNFTKFTGKHLCQNLFFNKVAGLSPKNTFSYRTPPVAAPKLYKHRLKDLRSLQRYSLTQARNSPY